MKTRGVEPNAITFNSAISALSAGRRPQRALALLRAMCASGVEPTIIRYNAAMSGFGGAARAGEARGLLREMIARGLRPSVVSYATVISACEKGREWGWALEVRGQKLPPIR